MDNLHWALSKESFVYLSIYLILIIVSSDTKSWGAQFFKKIISFQFTEKSEFK